VRRCIGCFALAAGCLTVTACGGGGGGGSGDASSGHITVSSPSIASGQPIPTAYACTGKDISPPLSWSSVPKEATDLRLVITDADAKGFVHWKVTGIPADVHDVAAGKVPKGGRERRNSFGKAGYGGPCPPPGEGPHHYVFTVTALDANGKPLDEGSLTATFDR
jgi:Raf kinase inhibitor-like YbhB/YbcL family protein